MADLFLFQGYIVDSGKYKIVSYSVIDWLMEHRTADSIEEVTEEMLVAVSSTNLTEKYQV